MTEANIGKITAFEMKPGHVYLISPDRQLTQAMHQALKADWREAIDELPEDQRPTVLVNGSPVSVVEAVQPAVVHAASGGAELNEWRVRRGERRAE